MDSGNKLQGNVVRKRGSDSNAFILQSSGSKMSTSIDREYRTRWWSDTENPGKSFLAKTRPEKTDYLERKLGKDSTPYLFQDSFVEVHRSVVSPRGWGAKPLARESSDTGMRRQTLDSIDERFHRFSSTDSFTNLSEEANRTSGDWITTSTTGHEDETRARHASLESLAAGPTEIPFSDDDADGYDEVVLPKPLARVSEDHYRPPKVSRQIFHRPEIEEGGDRVGEVLYESRFKERLSVDSVDRESELEKLLSKQQEKCAAYWLKLYKEALRKGHVKMKTCFHPFHLTEFEAVAILNVLEDVLCQLNVLLSPYLPSYQGKNVVYYRTIEERFAITRLSEATRLRDCGIVGDESFAAVKEKLCRESYKLLSILEDSFDELLWDGNYPSLQTFVIIPQFVLKEEIEMLKGVNHTLIELNERRRALSHFREDIKEKCDAIHEKKCQIRGYFRRLAHHLGKEATYVKKWEDSRKFQLHYRIERQMKQLSKRRDEQSNVRHLDQYAHKKLMGFLRLEIQELQGRVDYFEEKLEREIEDFAIKLNLEAIQLRRVKEHVKQTKLDSETLEQQVQHERDLKLRIEAAIVIQRWWRFMMLRHGLPQKKKKKKGKKKKGKKGKKKGKKKKAKK